MSAFPRIPDGTFEERAQFFADHEPALRAFYHGWAALKDELREAVAERGAVKLPNGGAVSVKPMGWVWDEEAIAAEYPDLVSEIAVTYKFSDEATAQQAMSLVGEQTGELPAAIKPSTDKTALARAIRDGGPAGQRLELMRAQKPGTLEVRNGH